jgi:hypothetical protein
MWETQPSQKYANNKTSLKVDKQQILLHIVTFSKDDWQNFKLLNRELCLQELKHKMHLKNTLFYIQCPQMLTMV